MYYKEQEQSSAKREAEKLLDTSLGLEPHNTSITDYVRGELARSYELLDDEDIEGATGCLRNLHEFGYMYDSKVTGIEISNESTLKIREDMGIIIEGGKLFSQVMYMQVSGELSDWEVVSEIGHDVVDWGVRYKSGLLPRCINNSSIIESSLANKAAETDPTRAKKILEKQISLVNGLINTYSKPTNEGKVDLLMISEWKNNVGELYISLADIELENNPERAFVFIEAARKNLFESLEISSKGDCSPNSPKLVLKNRVRALSNTAFTYLLEANFLLNKYQLFQEPIKLISLENIFDLYESNFKWAQSLLSNLPEADQEYFNGEFKRRQAEVLLIFLFINEMGITIPQHFKLKEVRSHILASIFGNASDLSKEAVLCFLDETIEASSQPDDKLLFGRTRSRAQKFLGMIENSKS